MTLQSLEHHYSKSPTVICVTAESIKRCTKSLSVICVTAENHSIHVASLQVSLFLTTVYFYVMVLFP